MPHPTVSRSSTWTQAYTSVYSLPLASQSQSHLPSQKSQSHRRTGSNPTITISASSLYLPLPYVKPATTSSRPASRGSSNGSYTAEAPQNKKVRQLPSALLPSRPQPVRAHPRNELQRRSSPTATAFSPVWPTSPLWSGAPAVQDVPGMQTRIDGVTGDTEVEASEMYTLTLQTNPKLEEKMKSIASTSNSSTIPPAQVMLFPSLPSHHISRITANLESLAQKVPNFEVATGKTSMKANGQSVLSVGVGEREIRRIFVSLRTSWWGWLDEDDRAFQGVGWVLTDGKDPLEGENIKEALKTVEDGEMKGWATGLCLWKNENGQWCKVKEFGFAINNVEGMEGGELKDVAR